MVSLMHITRQLHCKLSGYPRGRDLFEYQVIHGRIILKYFLIFKRPVFTYMNTQEINFVYLGSKEIYCILRHPA